MGALTLRKPFGPNAGLAGGISLLAVLAAFLPASALAQTVVDTPRTTAVTVSAGSTLVVRSTGSIILPTGRAVNMSGSGGTVENAGTIQAQRGIGGFAPGTIVNTGTIRGTAGAAVELDLGSVSNSGATAVIAGSSNGVYFSDDFDGRPATVTNSNGASISGSSTSGVTLGTGGTVTNHTGSTIQGGMDGVMIYGEATVRNSGTGSTISSTTGRGIGYVGSQTGTSLIENSDNATISGRTAGIYIQGGAIITNSTGGTIAATGGTGIQFGSGGGIASITNNAGSTIRGTTAAISSVINTTLVNAGTITGNVTLGNTVNSVTLHTGSSISGTLTMGTGTNNSLTLTGAGTQSWSTGATTFSGAVANLYKTGTGTWTVDRSISAANVSVSEGTLNVSGTAVVNLGSNVTVSGGTLNLNSNGRATSGATVSGGTVNINSNGRLGGGVTVSGGTINANSGGQLNGAVTVSSGTLNALAGTTLGGAITVTGGTFNIGSGLTLTNTVNLSGGVLNVDGRLNQALVVAAGARLTGSGTIGGNITINGTFSPGNSPGTMAISGTYTAGAASIYEAEIDPANVASDRITVTGNAVITPGAQLKVVRLNATPYTIGTRYTVLSTTTGRSGTYTLTGDTGISAFLSLLAEYDANNAYLVVGQARALSAAGQTPNQRAVAAGLDGAPAGNAFRNAILAMPDDAAARAAFDALSGEIHAATRGTLLRDAGKVGAAAIDALRGDGGLWATTLGGVGRIAGDGNGREVLNTTGGFLFGADLPVAEHLRMGVLAGVVGRGVGVASSTADITSYTLGVYGAAELGDFAFRFGASTGIDDIKTRSTIGLAGVGSATASYAGWTSQVFAEAAYGIDLGAVIFEPFAGISFASLSTGGFSETGTGLAVAAATSDLVTSTIGLRASGVIDLGGSELELDGSLGWRHVIAGTPNTMTVRYGGPNFTVTSATLPADTLELGLGGTLALSENASLGLRYNGSFSTNAASHAVTGSLKISF